VLETRRAILALVWSPGDLNQLACAFKHWNEVHVYDLELGALSHAHRVGHRAKGSAGGNPALCYAPWPRGAGHDLIAGSAYGVLRCWAASSRAETLKWELQTRSKAGGGVGGLVMCAPHQSDGV
jgi:hypothetical protein